MADRLERFFKFDDRRLTRREELDRLRQRLALLVPADRVLLDLHINQGASFRQLAAVSGLSARTVGRQIHQLIQHLVAGPYVIFMRHRAAFTGMELAAAYDYYLLGLSVRRIGIKRGLTYYRAQQVVVRLAEWLRYQDSHGDGARRGEGFGK
jgi:hypothetical protein